MEGEIAREDHDTGVAGGVTTAAVAVLAVVAAGAAALVLVSSAGGAATAWPLPSAGAYAARAEAALLTGAGPNALSAAQAATRSELALAPRSVDAQLRLAMIATARDGGLTVGALNALKASYRLSRIDPDLWRPRIAFALEHWTELDDAARILVRDEISVTSHHRDAQAVRDTILAVSNPTGRFAGLVSYSFVATPPPPARPR